MKVALVHDHLVQDGGAERVLRVLMRMWPDAPVYTLVFDRKKMGPEFAAKDIRTSYLQKLPGSRRFYKGLLPLIPGAFRRFDLSGYDLVVSSASGFAKGVRTGDAPHVCYCHTPIRYIWSDSERYIRELPYPGPVKWLIKLIRPRLRRADLKGADGVDAFVANSRHVAARIKRYYERESTVIYPPVDISRFMPSDTRGGYFLIATRLEPYKRVDLAIEAANRLKLTLKIMGGGTDESRLRKLAGPTVEFLGRVSDDERTKLFAEADALLNPQEEDFGITTVESLASGVPVIAFAVGGAAEILEDGKTGILFREQNAESLAAALDGFDRTRFDSQALRARAGEFSEERFAKELRESTARAQQREASVPAR